MSLDESSDETGSDQDLSRPPTPPRIQVSLSPAAVQRNATKSYTGSPSSPAPGLLPCHRDSEIDFNPIESSPAPEGHNSQLFTDRQKEVAQHECQDVGNLFYGIQSKPMYKRFRNGGDMCSLLLDNAPAHERPSTPEFADIADAVKDELPKSSSPPRSSPIVAAMSRKSTPRKPLEIDHAQDVDDNLPSSPPPQITDELDGTRLFDIFEKAEIQEGGIAGFDDIQQHSNLLSPEDVDDTLVDATINPAHLTIDVMVSHDDLVEQARQRFEAGSSFSTGTDFIAGTDDKQEDEMQSILITAVDDIPCKDDLLLHGVTATDGARPSSPTLSCSGFLAEAQLIADLEASTQKIGDEENCETQQSSSTSISQIPATPEKSVSEASFMVIPATYVEDIDCDMQQISTAAQSNIPFDHTTTSNAIKRKAESSQFDMVRTKQNRRHSVSRGVDASVTPVYESNRPQTPDFDKLEDVQLHRILDVFNQQPDVSFDEIVLTTGQKSKECHTKSGQSKRFMVKEARNAWSKMDNEQRADALRDNEDAATKQTQEQVVKKRGRPRGRKSQSRWQLGATDQQNVNSGQAKTQSRMEKMNEVTTRQDARAKRRSPVSKIPNEERRKSSRHSEMLDAMDTDPSLVRDSPLPGDRRGIKRRSSQLIAPQEKAEASESELEISCMTEPRLVKKPRIETDDDGLPHVVTPPRGVPRRRAIDVRLTPRKQLSVPPSSLTRGQDQPPPEAFSKGCDEANVGTNAMMVDRGEGFFSFRQGNVTPPIVPGTYNEEASPLALSPKTFIERFTWLSEKWRKMFEDCKRMVGRLPSQDQKQVEEKLGEMGDDLRDVIKVMGRRME